jgi:hypothetical protein
MPRVPRGARSVAEGAQAVEVENVDAAVFAAHQPGILQHLEALVGALAETPAR